MTVLLITDNEKGSAIVFALLGLALLTIIGVGNMNTSIVENAIVRNERLHQENFYNAESATNEGARILELSSELQLDDRTFNSVPGLESKDSQNIPTDDPTTWETTDTSLPKVNNGTRGTTRFSMTEEGISRDASLDMTVSTNMYEYKIRGLCDDTASGNGYALIEIGYKKRH